MKRKRWMQIIFYLAFGVLVIFAFFISERLSKDPENTVEKISAFSVLLENKEISALYYDKERMWVGCNEGVLICNPVTGEIETSIDDLEVIYTSGIRQTPDGTVWIGHEEGLTGICADGSRIDFAYPDIPKGRINTVEWDGKSLWCGSYSGAASLNLTAEEWRPVHIYGRADGLISNSVNVIRWDGVRLWFASYLDTRDGGITVLKDGKMTCIGTQDGLPHPYITSLEVLKDGRVLAGCGYMDNGGMAVISVGEGEPEVTGTFGKSDGIPGEKVRYLFLDGSGYLWITTEYNGVLTVNYGRDGLKKPLSGLIFTMEHGLSDNEIKCMEETEEYYWLGGKYGLTLIRKSYIREQMERE